MQEQSSAWQNARAWLASYHNWTGGPGVADYYPPVIAAQSFGSGDLGVILSYNFGHFLRCWVISPHFILVIYILHDGTGLLFFPLKFSLWNFLSGLEHIFHSMLFPVTSPRSSSFHPAVQCLQRSLGIYILTNSHRCSSFAGEPRAAGEYCSHSLAKDLRNTSSCFIVFYVI